MQTAHVCDRDALRARRADYAAMRGKPAANAVSAWRRRLSRRRDGAHPLCRAHTKMWSQMGNRVHGMLMKAHACELSTLATFTGRNR